ncbi:MAG: hypothetical protein ABFS38_03345 [Bacteroidota bacterium]
MEINRNNYEAYLLDLIEGSLSAEDQMKLRDFLTLNPDCAEGINDVEPWILEKSKILFPGREQLKKDFPDASSMLTETNFDLFSIARLEGDLTLEQERDHAAMVAENEEKGREWDRWQRTKLQAEPITFAEKEQLKRKKGMSRRVIWMGILSSAAVIAFLVILLRIDMLTHDSELAMEAPATQSVEEEQPLLPASDPLSKEEAIPVIAHDETEASTHKPVLFSIKKSPGQPLESQDMKNSEANSDTVKQVHQEEIKPGAVKIAGNLFANKEFVDKGSYDLIKPLDIPVASGHLTIHSLAQLAEVDLQEVFDDYTRENEISLWTIANAGIKGINRLTGADMSLLAARDNEGDVSGFRFKSKRLSIATPIERSE